MGFWKKAKTADTPGTWEGTEKYGPVKLASVDFRDGQQSVIATRMRTEDMLPVLEQMDNFGYECIEMWGGATFDSCIPENCSSDHLSYSELVYFSIYLF